MFSRLIAMIAGRSVARTVGGLGGPAATAAGVLLPLVLRRLGPGGMVAAAVAGHVVRRAHKAARPR